ncbi:TnsA-like heteromeric transposase endonuclease subunit [Pseudarthrobacter sp. Y6]|uniref:TnsA-like heteromeric transposase endonuclease subunit n=1 Tax=Pseudarthrobacter sp. Y6 TaxID=3418422 RepID=UPI003CFBA1FF
MGHAAAAEAYAGRDIAPGTLTYREQFSSAPRTGHLAECWMIPFENSLPIRRLTAFKGQRNFAGLWWCATNQRHVGFESWCERDNLMLLDFDPDVAGFSSQPFRIDLPASLPQSSHVPDYFIRLADGSAVVIDVRPDSRVTPADQEIFQATEDLCATVGWAYRRLGGLPPVLLAKLQWLSGYRHPRFFRASAAAKLLDRLAVDGPMSIRSLAIATGDPVTTLAPLFHLLWKQQISTDVRRRVLHYDTVVWLNSEAP